MVHAAHGGTLEEAANLVRAQQNRPENVGVSCAIAASGQRAVGYVGLIKRPRVEMGVVRALEDGKLVFSAHDSVVGIGYWVAPGAQGNGLATRAVVLLSRWALHSAGAIRVEALLEPTNFASRRVVEKSGFQSEGQLRLYMNLDGHPADALVYSLLLTDL